MQNWISYLVHEEGKTVIDDVGGFIAFFINKGDCFVTDFFVEENKRGTGLALKLANGAEDFAKKSECDRMTCNIFINDANRGMFGHKVRIFSEFGFVPTSANNNVVTMMKGI